MTARPSRRRRTCSTTACSGSTIDGRGLIASLRRPARRPRGDRPRRGGQPAAAAPRHPEPLGRLGRRRALPPHVHRPRPRPTRSIVDARRPARCAIASHASARRRSTQLITLRAGQRGRSTSTPRSTGTSARSCSSSRSRSTCTPTGRPSETQFGHVAPADPHQHLLGRGPVRDLRAPLGARRRARLRRRGRQRLDLRPRRHPHDARATAARRRRSGCRCCARPRFPDPETDQGAHRFRYALRRRRRRSPTPSAEGYRDQPAAARGRAAQRAVAPLVTRRRPGRRGRGGQARRGP